MFTNRKYQNNAAAPSVKTDAPARERTYSIYWAEQLVVKEKATLYYRSGEQILLLTESTLKKLKVEKVQYITVID